MEVVHKETQSFWELESPKEDNSDDTAIQKVFTSKKESFYRCGGTGHSAFTCYHKDKTCSSYRKSGHLSRVCRSKLTTEWQKGIAHHQVRKAHLVEPKIDLTDCQSSDEEPSSCIHKVADRERYSPNWKSTVAWLNSKWIRGQTYRRFQKRVY